MAQAKFETTFASHENGIKFTVEDKMTAHMLSNAEKKDLVYHCKDEPKNEPKTAGKKGKKAEIPDDNEQEIA